MSRPSFVATAGGFCMAGSSRPAEPVNTAAEATSLVTKKAQPDTSAKPSIAVTLK